jgi:hypothetical protein
MKIIYLIIFLFISSTLKSQALYPSNLMLDFYGGFPNFGKILVTSNLGKYESISLNGLGPSGVRAEYMIDDNIGVGVDVIHNYVNFKYQLMDTSWFGDQLVINSNDYHSIMKRLRVHFRFNYHIEHENPRIDSYFGFGIGYNSRTYASTKNNLDNTSEFKSRIQLIPFPVSARVCFGGRYYFSQYVGLVGEVGLGGPLISLGLALKY